MRALQLAARDVHRGELIVVNARQPLRQGPAPRLAPADDAHPDILLHSKAAALLAQLVRAVGGAGHIVPVSGWRSLADQQAIWDDSLAEHGQAFTQSYVARPGCSEHQTGLAVDLGKAAPCIDFLRPAFPYDGVCGAFRRQAARYGFIERYEQGKEDLTGIAHEPWHFRYVGAPHAQLMRRNGLCLEEYPAFLAQRPRTCTLENGRIAQLFYVPCQGEVTCVEVPDGCCQVSGDNGGGFIVTVWGRAV